MYDVQSIKDAADIQLVAEDIGIPMEFSKGKWMILCPCHDDHNFGSCSLNQKENTFKCYSCGAYGDVFKLVQEFMKVPFRQACEIVSETCGGSRQFKMDNTRDIDFHDAQSGPYARIIPKEDQEFLGLCNEPVYVNHGLYDDADDVDDRDSSHVEAVYDKDDVPIGYTVRERVTSNPLRDLYLSDPDTYHELVDNYCIEKIARLRYVLTLFQRPEDVPEHLRSVVRGIMLNASYSEISTAVTDLIKRAQNLSVKHGAGAALDGEVSPDMERIVALATDIWHNDEDAPF